MPSSIIKLCRFTLLFLDLVITTFTPNFSNANIFSLSASSVVATIVFAKLSTTTSDVVGILSLLSTIILTGFLPPSILQVNFGLSLITVLTPTIIADSSFLNL